MNFRNLLSKQSINHLSRLKPRKPTSQFIGSSYNASTISTQISSSPNTHDDSPDPHPSISSFSRRHFHSSPEVKFASLAADPEPLYDAGDDTEDADDTMNEFLSRFVYIMRAKLNEAYPGCDKQTTDGMLLVIVEKVVAEMEKGTLGTMLSEALSDTTASRDFSDDLWKAVWEVSTTVCEDMEKERKKEQMKKFLQSEEVKKMARFASEVGIRGDMLRELKFKWAREKMEESEFYEGLRKLQEEEKAGKQEGGEGVEVRGEDAENAGLRNGESGEKEKIVGLPKRKGKIRYKIYGLDLSASRWKEVADKIHVAEEVAWPKEAKPITGKCKLVKEKILSMEEEDDPSLLLAEWVELLQPSRADWESLLQRLQERNARLYYKVAEHVLNEPTFQANIRDFSKLIDAYAKESRVEDVERILMKMDENGLQTDVLILTTLVHMYCKSSNFDRARQAFEMLRNNGFKPDMHVYTSMIMASINADEPEFGEALLREMEARRIEPTEEILMGLLRSYAQQGHLEGIHRIRTTMYFAGVQPTLESITLVLEALGAAGRPDEARINFDYIKKLGLTPDDRSVAAMLAAYKKKNLLDKALSLLLHLEKEGFEPGIATYTALLDWLCQLQLIDEAEQILDKIARQGVTPPLKIHVSLCAMYSRAKMEKKALQSLGVLEAKRDQLGQDDFERIIKGLTDGGFAQDSRRMQELMEALGFSKSEQFKLFMMANPSL